MKEISSLVSNYLEKLAPKGIGRHWKWGCTNDILKVVGNSKDYSFFYWLKQLKRFEERGGEEWVITHFLREIQNYPVNFNKGAILTNKLKNYGQAKNKLQTEK